MATFARDSPFPSWFANALGRALSLLAEQFVLTRSDATHVQLVAGANDQAVVLSIGGQWRWVEATITVAHPGGAAGSYPIFATAANNSITNTPDPFTDHTNYAFGLVIRPPGATPTIVAGTVDVFRHVADAVWDGAQITRIDQLATPVPLHAGRHATAGPDPLTPAQIGAVATGDAHTLQTGDLVISGASSRAGALLCDGTEYSRTGSTAPLFAKIGTRYGAGNGSTTFNVPNFTDRQIIGASVTNPLGSVGGAEWFSLVAGQLPPHFHGFSGNTGNESADHAHPFLAFTSSDSADGLGRHGPVGADSSVRWGGGGVGAGGASPAIPTPSAVPIGDSGFSHQHSVGGVTTGQRDQANTINQHHTHAYSGNTDNGPGNWNPISLRDPFGTANVFILM